MNWVLLKDEPFPKKHYAHKQFVYTGSYIEFHYNTIVITVDYRVTLNESVVSCLGMLKIW